MAYRINSREMTTGDCHANHVSSLWVDGSDSDDAIRRGVSCCATLTELVDYFADGCPGNRTGRDADFGDAYLVELEGDESDDEAWDEGELLLHPTRIISCEPMGQTGFLIALESELNRACKDDERVTYDAEYGIMRTQDRCEACGGTGIETDKENIEMHGDAECWQCDGQGWMTRH